jgi:NTP pyrophosphatase (non-canonical NTP hydrolase)
MVNKEDLKYIKENLSTNDAYCQLAEEAAELAHAALKVIRAINNTNPTPKTILEAIDTLHEEAADVFNALYVVIDVYEFIKVRDIAKRKMKRWKERLKSKDV